MFRGNCEKCGKPVDPERDGKRAAFPVLGWEVERKEGGANQIHGRTRIPDRVRHEGCLPPAHLHEGQEALL